MKKIALIVLSAVILFAAPSCKKQQCKVLKHVVSEEYVYADPCEDNANANAEATVEDTEKEVKIPRLSKFHAKKLVKEVLKENKVINTPRVTPIAVGYYELNDPGCRTLLYKAQVNGLVDVEYTDIVNHNDVRTYWVNVALTAKGKALIVENDEPIFPEDTITDYSPIQPNSGKNKYGEYTFDYNVASDVVTLITDFYNAYLANKNAAIYSYGTNDLIMAQERILKAIELGVRKNVRDPFTRKTPMTAEAIAALSICKWTSYVDLYIVKIAEAEFCIVVKEEGGVKKIDDIALNAPAALSEHKTWRCFAMGITAKELHDAQKALDARPARPQRLDPVAPSVPNAQPVELLFGEYTPALIPGIEKAVHEGPLPYELAKLAEYYESFDLLAFDKKLAKMGKVKDVKSATTPTKKAEITIKTIKVSPLGRICYGEKDGETEKFVAYFQYFDEEWICVGVHEKTPFPAVDCSAVNPRLGFVKDAEVIPNLTEQLNDQPSCSH